MRTKPNLFTKHLACLNFLAVFLLFAIFLLLSKVSHSETIDKRQTDHPADQWQRFNMGRVDNYIIPAYLELGQKAENLHKQVIALCSHDDEHSKILTSTRDAFHHTMNAWQYIQNVQFGPIQTYMRNYSMQFWPDKKNHVGKHLAQLLVTEDPNALSDDEFRKASVSIKGLPAVERLLFDSDYTDTLKPDHFHCQVLQRINLHIHETTQALTNEWQEMRLEFLNASSAESYFEGQNDATTSLLKTLIEPIEIIRDLKILRPMGSEFGQEKVTRLESWRSERSLQNIKLNIQSLADFYFSQSHSLANQSDQAFGPSLHTLLNQEEAEQIAKSFLTIQNLLDGIPNPIETSISSSEGYERLQSVAQALKTLHTQLEAAVNNQGFHLGFNSRDGD